MRTCLNLWNQGSNKVRDAVGDFNVQLSTASMVVLTNQQNEFCMTQTEFSGFRAGIIVFANPRWAATTRLGRSQTSQLAKFGQTVNPQSIPGGYIVISKLVIVHELEVKELVCCDLGELSGKQETAPWLASSTAPLRS